jgi:hypothetical protein
VVEYFEQLPQMITAINMGIPWQKWAMVNKDETIQILCPYWVECTNFMSD